MKLSHPLVTVLFAISLFSCHERANENDLYNIKATVPEKFNIAKMQLVVINTSINKKDSTMSILYGNKLAYGQLKQGISSVKSGELLALVSWKQQADIHWFGANIPGKLLSVEYVRANSTGNGAEYEKLLAPALKEDANTTDSLQREAFILSQRPSVMP